MENGRQSAFDAVEDHQEPIRLLPGVPRLFDQLDRLGLGALRRRDLAQWSRVVVGGWQVFSRNAVFQVPVEDGVLAWAVADRTRQYQQSVRDLGEAPHAEAAEVQPEDLRFDLALLEFADLQSHDRHVVAPKNRPPEAHVQSLVAVSCQTLDVDPVLFAGNGLKAAQVGVTVDQIAQRDSFQFDVVAGFVQFDPVKPITAALDLGTRQPGAIASRYAT